MKRTTIILCVLALLGIACYAWARSTVVSVVQGAAAPAGCAYPSVTQGEYSNEDYDRFTTANTYLGSKITTAQEYTTKVKIEVGIWRQGSPPAGDFTAYIYADNGSGTYPNDGTGRIQADAVVASSEVVGTAYTAPTYIPFIFTLASPLTTGTVYWIVVQMAGYTDTSNCYYITEDNTAGYVRNSEAGGTWGAVATKTMAHKIYACN
jgi:hypothetical protein